VGAVVLNNGKVLLRQRPPGGLLGGLWEFPNWNAEDGEDPKRSVKSFFEGSWESRLM
jgi:A/G-specific adenine glycosylase